MFFIHYEPMITILYLSYSRCANQEECMVPRVVVLLGCCPLAKQFSPDTSVTWACRPHLRSPPSRPLQSILEAVTTLG